jgi:hypothetical protein
MKSLLTPHFRRKRNGLGPYGHPTTPMIIAYGADGIPLQPREYKDAKWQKFLRKCREKISNYGLNYQEVIENRMVPIASTDYKPHCGLASEVSKEVILKTIETIGRRGQEMFTNRIAAELGVCSRSVRRLADRHGIELPNRQPWRKQPKAAGLRHHYYIYKHPEPLPIYVRRPF